MPAWPREQITKDRSLTPCANARIAVIVPCYRCIDHIEEVLARIGPEVAQIVVVDDACPQGTGKYVEAHTTDPRITVLYQNENTGVGRAVLKGMAQARKAGADILVKIDGDGQMPPELVEQFATPIAAGQADYTKGNRFYNYHFAKGMPVGRLIGNGMLSFFTKLASGYWNVFDPTNGYVAISGAVFDELPRQKIQPRYFFETDMLCELGLLRAVIMDIPMRAIYGDERSGLSPIREIVPFSYRNAMRFFRRVIYNYFVRDFSFGSIYLITGVPLLLFGLIFGTWQWTRHVAADLAASAGTVMLAALPVIIGFVLVLNFLAFDVMTVPKEPLCSRLGKTFGFGNRGAGNAHSPKEKRDESRGV